LWRMAGFTTGALPALFGARAVYVTIDAVETFVDGHYGAQIEALGARPEWRALRALLDACRADERAHRDEARA
ncbi:MAG: demethoxyubiquinone hydroxylase family protein, partial [Gammaproteobacteria bacterium]|nr:demethoxyubiquinone hydroxylase family protein [Gammaproteobacteria bacterium]NIM72550.1 demethoxyubiquinone hydroxylase family protein [Gammaproteobacteria bacterium]NIN37582.1 demethoxyubiquinone hydroxylase family protein [Gammaproteobacteria bacterium]NIO24309.1 demethoxyubiquinone hydroxylase family protein [Gammaproteobacteria bacterium]NIO64914.1 demethoxyubiquinone hydroxylase family protein [Gammaproteobacteria bacterium]